jgi:LysM repeat protein
MSPENAWGTRETIAYVKAALDEINALFPDTPTISIGDLSRKDGGHFRPHKSHQSGRDIDLGFFYVDGPNRHFQAGDARNMDIPRNWALVRALIVRTDVQMILVDKRIQKILYTYALSIGEDPEWLDSIFKAGRASIVKHARRHRGHYHVRFFNPRAQELARRIIPFMDKGREGTNFAIHGVRNGECLGSIARKYGTTVNAIRKANGLKSNSIRAGWTLTVPLYGPCVRCPVPPEVIVPERRIPPVTPVMFLASVQPRSQSSDRSPSKVKPAIERYIGAGGLFPPFRMYTIPMAY